MPEEKDGETATGLEPPSTSSSTSASVSANTSATASERKANRHKSNQTKVGRTSTSTTSSNGGMRDASGKSLKTKGSRGSSTRPSERNESRAGPPITKPKPKGLRKSTSMTDFKSHQTSSTSSQTDNSLSSSSNRRKTSRRYSVGGGNSGEANQPKPRRRSLSVGVAPKNNPENSQGSGSLDTSTSQQLKKKASSRDRKGSKRSSSKTPSRKKNVSDDGSYKSLPTESQRSTVTIIDDIGKQPPLQITKPSRQASKKSLPTESQRSAITIIDDIGDESPLQIKSKNSNNLSETSSWVNKTDRKSSSIKASEGNEQEQETTPGCGTATKESAKVLSEQKEKEPNNTLGGEQDEEGFTGSSKFVNGPDFGHLPDFQVGDFSFGDLNFPFDSNNDKLKIDDSKAADPSAKEEAKRNPGRDSHNTTEKGKEPSASISKPKPGDTIWICPNCKEEHDENKLQFCGMCGADRPKISPKPGGRSTRGSSAKRSPRRSGTQQSRDDSVATSSGSRKSNQSDGRPASTSALRKVRSSRPRSSRGGVQADENEVQLIVKCLDGADGEEVDLDALNHQLTTFGPSKTPVTPKNRASKATIRRCKSDVTQEQRPSSAPQTPRSLNKKRVPTVRSKTDTPGGPNTGSGSALANMRMHSKQRQAIPRRARNSTTEYLQQLQQNGDAVFEDNSARKGTMDELKLSSHSIGANSGAGSSGGNSEGFQSMESAGSEPSLAGSRPTVAAANARPSMAKTASMRFLGGISSISNTFKIGGVTDVMGGVTNKIGIPSLSKTQSALLLDSDEEGDEDEFASDLHKVSSENTSSDPGMLIEFPTLNDHASTEEEDLTRSPRRLKSAQQLPRNDDEGVTQTPRRRRASIAAVRQAHAKNLNNRSPRRLRNPVEPRTPRGSTQKTFLPESLDYDDVDIDVDDLDQSDVVAAADVITTPRRTRERITRPTIQRKPKPEANAKSELGLVTPRTLDARNRIRRATMAGFQAGVMPDLNSNEPPAVAPPAPPGMARQRIRRASLGAYQSSEPDSEPVAPPTKPSGGDAIPSSSGHGNRARIARPGRRRRGSVGASNPILQQAIAHMPKDPTHAVRSDLQEEWKRQEHAEDMRKKAMAMQKKYSSGLGGVAAPSSSTSLFDAGFDDAFGDGVKSSGGVEAEEEAASGADLELGVGEEDVSDISSRGEQ